MLTNRNKKKTAASRRTRGERPEWTHGHSAQRSVVREARARARGAREARTSSQGDAHGTHDVGRGRRVARLNARSYHVGVPQLKKKFIFIRASKVDQEIEIRK